MSEVITDLGLAPELHHYLRACFDSPRYNNSYNSFKLLSFTQKELKLDYGYVVLRDFVYYIYILQIPILRITIVVMQALVLAM